MQRFATSRLQGQHWLSCVARLVFIGALACSVLAASGPCAGMIAASSASNCCKRRGPVAVPERCHKQSVSSCCAEKPQTAAVVSSAAWATAGLAPQVAIREWRCFYRVTRAGAQDPHPSSYLQYSVLRI